MHVGMGLVWRDDVVYWKTKRKIKDDLQFGLVWYLSPGRSGPL